MLYADYKFFIETYGLIMADKDYPITIDKVPFDEGDKFVLETTEDGRLFFRRLIDSDA